MGFRSYSNGEWVLAGMGIFLVGRVCPIPRDVPCPCCSPDLTVVEWREDRRRHHGQNGAAMERRTRSSPTGAGRASNEHVECQRKNLKRNPVGLAGLSGTGPVSSRYPVCCRDDTEPLAVYRR